MSLRRANRVSNVSPNSSSRSVAVSTPCLMRVEETNSEWEDWSEGERARKDEKDEREGGREGGREKEKEV